MPQKYGLQRAVKQFGFTADMKLYARASNRPCFFCPAVPAIPGQSCTWLRSGVFLPDARRSSSVGQGFPLRAVASSSSCLFLFSLLGFSQLISPAPLRQVFSRHILTTLRYSNLPLARARDSLRFNQAQTKWVIRKTKES